MPSSQFPSVLPGVPCGSLTGVNLPGLGGTPDFSGEAQPLDLNICTSHPFRVNIATSVIISFAITAIL